MGPCSLPAGSVDQVVDVPWQRQLTTVSKSKPLGCTASLMGVSQCFLGRPQRMAKSPAGNVFYSTCRRESVWKSKQLATSQATSSHASRETTILWHSARSLWCAPAYFFSLFLSRRVSTSAVDLSKLLGSPLRYMASFLRSLRRSEFYVWLGF